MSSVIIPHSYSEWVTVLNMFKNKTDDESVVSAMKQGTIEWQTGVAERFVRKFAEALNSRMNEATDNFQKQQNRSMGQERVIVQSILALRKELKFLSYAADLPAIPESDRPKYVQLVLSQADSIQEALEESAKKDRSGKLSMIVRNNRVNAF